MASLEVVPLTEELLPGAAALLADRHARHCAAEPLLPHVAAAGCRRHQVLVPASDAALIDPWFRLAFGLQFMTAVRETAPVERYEANVSLRASTPEDLHHVVAFDHLLYRLQAQAPSFSGL